MACGGGSQLAPEGDSSAGGGSELSLRVQLPPELLTQSTSPLLGLDRIEARLLSQEQVVRQVQAQVNPGDTEVFLSFGSIFPAAYRIEVDALSEAGQVLGSGGGDVLVNFGQLNTVSIAIGNVAPSGEPPVAEDDSYMLEAGSSITVSAVEGVLSNDTSQNGTVTILTPPAQGDLTLNPDGSFQYFSAGGAAAGTETFVYQLQDVNGTDTATVTLQLTGRSLFVRANAVGSGTLSDPRGDLEGALVDAVAGDIVFILHSTDPLIIPNVTVPGGVNVIGEATGLTIGGEVIVPPGPRPTVSVGAFSFDSANQEVLLSGFRTETGLGVGCIDWTGFQNFRAENLHLSSGRHQVRFIGSTGSGSFTDCMFLNGGPGGTTLSGSTGMAPTNLTFENSDMGGSVLRLNTTGSTAELTLVYRGNTSANGAGMSLMLSDGATADVSLRNLTYTAGFPAFTFDHSDAGETVIDFTDCDFAGFGGFTYHQAVATGGGSKIDIRNLEIDNSGSRFDFIFRTGLNELVMNQVNYTNTTALTNQHLIITNDDNARARIRIEDNEFQRGANVVQSGVSMELGFLNNLVGVGGGGAGPLRRVLNIGGNSGIMCAKIFGNAGGSFINISQGAPGVVNLEGLATVTTDNTADAAITLFGILMDVPDGTCDFPDL